MKHQRFIAATVLLSLPFMSFAKSVAPSYGAAKPSAKSELLFELTGKDVSKESDIKLYAEMVGAYERNDEIGFKSRLQSLLSRFPKSPYADNALFLAGRMAVDSGSYPQAVKYFSQIEKNYPLSNKVPAARFAKAMTYKKMNLNDIAKKLLAEVRLKYAGSPESFRADSEIKLIN